MRVRPYCELSWLFVYLAFFDDPCQTFDLVLRASHSNCPYLVSSPATGSLLSVVSTTVISNYQQNRKKI